MYRIVDDRASDYVGKDPVKERIGDPSRWNRQDDHVLAPSPTRVGVISNPRSHLNKHRIRAFTVEEGVLFKRQPHTPEELKDALRSFVAENVELIVIDGGDGTIRDVLTAAAEIYPAGLPRMAVLPSGKTNALAIDLQIPDDATLADLIEAHRENRVKVRSALEIVRDGSSRPFKRGFVFGSGAYVLGTELAQSVHRFGWFNSVAIALSITWALLQTFFGPKNNRWRRGEQVRYVKADNSSETRNLYLVMGSTLKRLPLGLKPFGPVRAGLKFMAVVAPPRRLFFALPRLLRGDTSPKLREAGYLQADLSVLKMFFRRSFILDGEQFPGGALVIRESEPMEFVVP